MYRRSQRRRRLAQTAIAVGVGLVGVIAVFCWFAPLFGFTNPDAIDFNSILSPPSRDHFFGTDSLGRDVFTRVLYGGRVDIQVGIIATYVPLTIGLLVGAVAGYFGGWVDQVISWLINLVMSFPFLVSALALIAIVGPGLVGVYIAIIVVSWSTYARITRAGMRQLRETQFILAVESLGMSRRRLILRHALPNLLQPNLTFSVLDIILNILALASLSYLGLGVQPPTAEWGAIIAEGQSQLLYGGWWVSTLPGVVIIVFGLGLSLIADGVADGLGTQVK